MTPSRSNAAEAPPAPLRVLVIGATGFVGRALVPALCRDGHTVMAWVRSAARARQRLGADPELVDASGGAAALQVLVERSDAVINLAGEPLMGRRWTAARRQQLRASRVQVTGDVVAAITAARQRPRVLISSSAVGYYGDRGAEALPESAHAGSDFLSQLCQDWEAAAEPAAAAGVRVVTIRTGVALGRDGGALAPMLPAFRAGVGGPIGSGRQYLPWIHLHDLVRVFTAALADEHFRGPVNAVAPEQVTSRGFASALGRALHRPSLFRVPAFVLRAIFGEAATVLLSGQRVDPGVLSECGFQHAFPTLQEALADILGAAGVTVTAVPRGKAASSDPEAQAYLAAARPSHVLRVRTVLPAPLDEVFAFFSKAENLGLLTPSAMQFAIQGDVPAMARGARIRYNLRVGPIPVRWQTHITAWVPGHRFVDLQEAGPYRVWWHEHAFRSEGDRTVMDDCVYYAPPLGVLGRIANRFMVAPMLRQVFGYRRDVIRLRFGVG